MDFKDQNVYYVFVEVASNDYGINLLMILFVFLRMVTQRILENIPSASLVLKS